MGGGVDSDPQDAGGSLAPSLQAAAEEFSVLYNYYNRVQILESSCVETETETLVIFFPHKLA